MVTDYDEDEKHRYNESLVKRGEILLDFDVIDNWSNADYVII